ncbi:MAG: peptidoglycan DD-metalloendopeptidase family protein [Acutalibacteraceae bacterium]|nr:peptidoglycan DD-metalloendopeptidase family protein [Acutalibacteraceae bacterium]
MIAVLCTLVIMPSVTANAESVSELEDKLSEAQSDSAEIEAKISSLEDEKAPYEEQASALKEQIEITQNEIELYREQIKQCEENIAEQQKALDELQDQFKKRLVSIYKSSNYSSLQLLLTSDDMSEYLTKKEFLKSQSEKDAKLIEQIIEERNELEKQKVVLDNAKDKLDEKIEDLDVQYEKYNKIVAEYQDQIEAQKEALAEAEALEEQIQADIEEAKKKAAEAAAKAAESNNTSGYIPYITEGSGQFAWPVPGYYSISSYYGWRWGRLHGGLDISSSGIYGAGVVASDSGTVILSYAGNYGGYGNCVMIDHGNGFTTVYAHLAYAPSVYEGQVVSQGTTIGYVGSTGNSTGPHLHFEIRYNGSTQDPLNYL